MCQDACIYAQMTSAENASKLCSGVQPQELAMRWLALLPSCKPRDLQEVIRLLPEDLKLRGTELMLQMLPVLDNLGPSLRLLEQM